MSGAAPPREPARRLFFALWPDEAARAALADAAREAVSACAARAAPAENLHATLAFLGSVPERRIGELQDIAGRVADTFVPELPVTLQFDELAHWAGPKILVALSALENLAAQALAQVLKTAAQAAGFAPDLKAFHAHVTLARKVARAPAVRIARPVTWHFDGFALVESRTSAAGAAYSVVQSYLLVKQEKAHRQTQN
ncbi:MAG: RNA 2',3'-cyclic phosphodiesterase [Steroidobacterales bacterium]